MSDISCGYECSHTAEEHEAFDKGLAGKPNEYADPHLREIWEIGNSVRELNER